MKSVSELADDIFSLCAPYRDRSISRSTVRCERASSSIARILDILTEDAAIHLENLAHRAFGWYLAEPYVSFPATANGPVFCGRIGSEVFDRI